MAKNKEIFLINSIVENINESDSSSSESSESFTESFSSDLISSDEEFVQHHNIKNFIETIYLYDEVDFKKNFRLSRRTANILIESYKTSSVCPKHHHGGRDKVGAEKEIYLFLWYIANTITYRQLSSLFGIAEKTAWTIVNRVASWMMSIADNYVKWPRTPQAVQRITSGFERMKGIKGVLGAIDGTHIQIKAPSKQRHLYCNRKKYFSILMQAVVDSKKKFIDVYIGEPGSLHDARVLRRSHLYRKATEEYQASFLNKTFLLGDSAYPSKFWLVTPFKDTGNLTEDNRKFNYLHSATRIVVENTFGLLKTRFRRLLHFTEHTNLRTVVNLIMASCILHNICIDEGDEWNFTEEESDSTQDILMEDFTNETNNRRVNDRRQMVINDLRAQGIM